MGLCCDMKIKSLIDREIMKLIFFLLKIVTQNGQGRPPKKI